MDTKEINQKTKVLVNVYEPLIKLTKRKFDEACLKRDAYLDKALRIEASLLRDEVVTSNSEKAKSYITESLKSLDLKPVNLLLSAETANLMNKVCKEKNIPRDAFINRFFLLLIASDKVIDALFFDLWKKYVPFMDFEVWESEWLQMDTYVNKSNVPDTIKGFVKISPFWRLRDFFSHYDENWKMYGYPFEKDALSNLPVDYSELSAQNIIGFNTFMSDDEIPEQEVHDSEINKEAGIDRVLVAMKQEEQERQVKIDKLRKDRQVRRAK